MSSEPISDDENPKIDDEGAIGLRTEFDPEEPIGEAVSEVIRKPTRTAGDLSEESVALKSWTARERELLEDLLRRVERIEQHLGIANADSDVE
jgi:hypothetical protein